MESPRAIILIEADDKGGFKVNPEALEVLSNIKKPLAVVSVVGKYRTGKSFLLNRILLDRKSGFGVGPTIMACTKGIWMWSEPIMLETVDGEECALILLDTEGLGALDENANHDTRIFLLALLLASNFIYNSVGSLDETALSNLSLIVNLTKQLQVRSSVGPQDVDEMSAYFPSLLWVLRDFSLQLIDKAGNEISPKDYLENALMPQKGVSDNVEQKNRIRRYIKHFFKERDCFPLIRPSEEEEVLQTLDEASEDVLRPEFVTQMLQLRKFIQRKAKIKMLNGKKMNGDMLGSLATAYVTAINTGSVPNIDTAWNYMCKSECDRLTQASVSDLEVKMTGFQYPEEGGRLKEIYQTARDELLLKFRQQAVGQQVPVYEADLKGKLREVYARVKENNEKAVGLACEKTFAGVYRELVEKLKAGEYAQLGSFKRDLDAYSSEFRKGSLKGLTAEKKLSEFSQKLLSEAADYINRNASQESQNQQRRMAQSLELAQSQLVQKKEEWNREAEDLKSRLEKAEKDGHSIKAQIITLNMQVEEHQREKGRIEERHKERIEEMKKDHAERNADIKERMEEANKQLLEVQGKHVKETAMLERDKALLEQELKFRKDECEDLKAKRSQLEADNKSLRSELRLLREGKPRTEASEDTDEVDIDRLKNEVVDLKEQLKSAQGRIGDSRHPGADSELEQEVDRLRAEVARLRDSRPSESVPGKPIQDRKPISTDPRPAQAGQQLTVNSEELQAMRDELARTKKQLKDAVDQKNAAVRRMQAEQTQAAQTAVKAESPAAAIGESKELLQKAVGVVCRFCSQVVILQYFAGHQEECEREYEARLRSNPELTLISVPQASADHRGEKFVISCKRRERIWVVTRTFEAIKKLQATLDSAYPDFEYPAFAEVIRTAGESAYSKARGMPISEKQKEVEKYLVVMANGGIGTSPELRQFLG